MRIERDYLRTGVAIAAIVLAFVLVILLPNRIDAANLRQRISAAQLELEEGAAARSQLPSLRAEYARLSSELAASDKYVPVEPEMASLMREIHAALERQNARRINTRHGEVFIGAHFNVVPITIEFQATFIDAFLFIEHIESMQRMVRVNRVDLAGDRESPLAKLNVTLELSAFYAPQREGE